MTQFFHIKESTKSPDMHPENQKRPSADSHQEMAQIIVRCNKKTTEATITW